VNEYAPTFSEPSYVRQVDEGRIYSEIVRVEATDRDCTPKFGDVCKYEILTSDQPFVIDMEGIIRNTEPLDYERSHNHILSVVAYDCGGYKVLLRCMRAESLIGSYGCHHVTRYNIVGGCKICRVVDQTTCLRSRGCLLSLQSRRLLVQECARACPSWSPSKSTECVGSAGGDCPRGSTTPPQPASRSCSLLPAWSCATSRAT
jgi:hypothetical protein